MESYYLIVLICLIALAVSDLVVGVSNDAVNFLNSAFGSKVAAKRTVLIVASAGIMLGAASSSGMMEIARKGIFNPEMFAFADIMVIFLAVMLTDIILLDLFNTFGMPTSTTVSIMFELLGAAFVVAGIKVLSNGDSFSTLGEYLNTDNAVLIIAGIFLSVLIAFSVGTLVQYIVRLMFSFNLDKTLKKYGPIFGGLAITIITYFMLIKGMKGSNFIPANWLEWIKANVILLLVLMTAFWTVCCYVLTYFFKLNILKIVVLVGTFSLAMAFAGNDLVNFIGVPIAGLQSYTIFESSSVAADSLNMGILGDKMQANTLILLGAGVIMILTLWFSKKAKSVTETEINLSREGVGTERFKSNWLSRIIVRGGIRMGRAGNKVLSANAKEKIEARFKKKNQGNAIAKDQPAFDLVRASVNLMVASLLIAFATSLKLPLSTTYVSFMVAMGTSLADRAWNRDSAVYRVAGVVNVISGWLFTAVIAFSAAGIIAVILFYGGIIAVIGLMTLTIFLIVRSQIIHKSLEKKKDKTLNNLLNRDRIHSSEVFKESEVRISSTLFKVSFILSDIIQALENNDRKRILKAKSEVNSYKKEHDELIASFYYYLKKIDTKGYKEGQFYMHALNYLQNISQSVHLIGEKVYEHVDNLHQPMQKEKVKELIQLSDHLSDLFVNISKMMGDSAQGNMKFIEDQSNEILLFLDHLERNQIERIKTEKSSPKNSMLYISIVLECRDILNDYTDLIALYEDDTPSSKIPSPDSKKELLQD